MLVEDICTSGGQVVEAANDIVECGGEVVKIVSVVDREEGAREAIEAAGYFYESLFTKTDLGI